MAPVKLEMKEDETKCNIKNELLWMKQKQTSAEKREEWRNSLRRIQNTRKHPQAMYYNTNILDDLRLHLINCTSGSIEQIRQTRNEIVETIDNPLGTNDEEDAELETKEVELQQDYAKML